MKKILFLIAISIIQITSACAQYVSLIPTGSSWKYLANGINQGTTWRAVTFDDTSWSSGDAELGYGDGGESTVVSYGPNSSSKYITTYFRKSFTVNNALSYSNLLLSLLRDDGAVVYLNGTEVIRSNMPSGLISYSKRALTNITGQGEIKYSNFNLPVSLLQNGINVIAVEIHQFSKTSPDISFNLSLSAMPLPQCGTPGSLVSSSVTQTSASLSWSAVAGAISYKLKYRPVGTSVWTITDLVSTSKVVTGLLSATTYEFAVLATCTGGQGPYSAKSQFYTLINGADTLINTNSSWKYLEDGSNQGTSWYTSTYNDNLWLTGNAELGYGDGNEATVVNFGPDTTSKYPTTYFRKTFNVSNPAGYAALRLGVVRDDGIVVYLNGTEVYRKNMPAGAIAYNTLASSAITTVDESNWYYTLLSPSLLNTGTNILAVEIHQHTGNSPDISFNAKLWGTGSIPYPTVTRGAYLQKVTPNSITVRWRTDLPSNSKVQYGTTLSYSNSISDTTLVTEHELNITGLSPSTQYFYSIGTIDSTLQGDIKNNFYTSPLPGTITPVRIWATGDFGNGSSLQTSVKNAFVNYTGTTPVNLWLWLGDNAYTTGTDAEYQAYVFSKYPDQLKSIPLYPSPGNHDYANLGYHNATTLTTNFPYFANFTTPTLAEAGGVASNTEKYYSYDYANIHFISLDSYGSLNTSTSPMYTWLNSDLQANTKRWTVVYFHHPPYTMGTHNSDTEVELIAMRNNIIPLLESYHVDLVLNGHSHVNERSFLIKGHYGLANTFNSSMKVSNDTTVFTKSSPFDGTIYAVCGTSGQSPGAFQTGYPMPCMYFHNNTNNCSLVIDVNGDNLSCKYLASTGTIVDQFSITKTGARITSPEKIKTVQVNNNIAENSVMVDLYLEKESFVTIEYLSASGQLLKTNSDHTRKFPSGFHRMDLQNPSWATGIYFLKITVDQQVFYNKIMIIE